MTQIGFNVQQTVLGPAFATDTSTSRTISAVDVSKTYIQLNGWASGKPLCVTCPGSGASTKTGTADDGLTGQWAVELVNSTTIRAFRNTPTGPGCRTRIDVTVIEYL